MIILLRLVRLTANPAPTVKSQSKLLKLNDFGHTRYINPLQPFNSRKLVSLVSKVWIDTEKRYRFFDLSSV